MENRYSSLSLLGSIATAIQLLLILTFTVSMISLGPRAESAVEAFHFFKQSDLSGLLKDEILLSLMISLYLINFSALFFLLKDHKFTLTFLGVLLTFCAVLLTLASHSGFSLMHLSHKYHMTTDMKTKEMLLSAGEAVLSRNMWNSTASYYAGFFLQGGAILVSIAMFGSMRFAKITIVTGILANGLDLIQHAIHHALPEPATLLLQIAGPFYLIWYIMLSIDLYKNSKRLKLEQ